MELGARLRQARLEAGLSQRQLCADVITRNMLSQIENGTAHPSMKTLQYLAERLGKSVSYFLDGPNMVSPNQQLILEARQFHDQSDWGKIIRCLEQYTGPDPLFDRERDLLWAEAHLALAEQAIGQSRGPYALELLNKAAIPTAYCQADLTRRRLLLLGRLPGQAVSAQLPSLDPELLLRASEALTEGKLSRASQLLSAVEKKDQPQYHLLQGEVFFRSRNYSQAASHFLQCGNLQMVAPKLEHCYKELGDYKRAYEYACLQKER